MTKINEDILNNADIVLILEDDRLKTGKSMSQGHLHVEPNDPRMWLGASYGRIIQKHLSTLGSGYGCEVSDMGRVVSVRMSYNNPGTGKTITKNYIILFDEPDKPDGICFISMSKWRTFNNYNQACQYISSSIKSYASAANSI